MPKGFFEGKPHSALEQEIKSLLIEYTNFEIYGFGGVAQLVRAEES